MTVVGTVAALWRYPVKSMLGNLPKDSGILRTAARANPRDFGPFQGQPCVGVYAEVTAGGVIRVGDPVHQD